MVSFESISATDPTLETIAASKIQQSVTVIADHLYPMLLGEHQIPELDQPLFEKKLFRTAFYSEFAHKILQRHIEDLCAEEIAAWFRPLSEATFKRQILSCITRSPTLASLKKMLRDYRNKEMLRIIFRDINGMATLSQTMCELSWLAEHLIHTLLNVLYEDLRIAMGTPMADGIVQRMYVVALGKLGAHELNLSSDVDLMFGYPSKGLTVGGPTVYSNQEFFVRLAQRLIRYLSEVSAEGFIFRVDMRLRPFGQSGALVWSTAAMVSYYEQHGREWERYALIKARALAGDRDAAEVFLREIRPFVFRRYIDFGVFDALRKMKTMIDREVKCKTAENNIKIGEGGIREVEFIAQVFQLLRGGRLRQLRYPSLLKTLLYCYDANLLQESYVRSLVDAYHFLRQLEHRLQAWQDRQTQDLPTSEIGRQRIAGAMGFADWSALLDVLNQVRRCVHDHFSEIVQSESASGQMQEIDDWPWQQLWQMQTTQEFDDSRQTLSALSDEEANAFHDCLQTFRDSVNKKALQEITLDRLDRLMPKLLQKIYEGEQKIEAHDVWARLAPASYVVAKELNVQWVGVVQTLRRVIRLLETVLRRSAYLALFIENPGALKELVRLCAASPWIADQLATFPNLLDELLDSSALYKVPDKRTLKDELRQQLLRVPFDDLERQMDTLRVFKHIHVLRVAASEVGSRLALMNVSDYLTYLAEVLLDEALTLVWQQMVDRYGSPTDHDGEEVDQDFIILGYGKLGGIELSYGSDLDLVFLYGAPSDGMTSGAQSIENLLFYTRVVQRLIHVLSTQTMSGVLYDVDLRLRPSGNKGLVVSSVGAFERYQTHDAWCWEHQALVRARVVVGAHAPLAKRFKEIRLSVLSLDTPTETLRDQVVKMRTKMRDHLGSKKADKQFHLKYDSGGMVDIEFIAQFMVLRYGRLHRKLLACTDNIRIFECLKALGLLADEQAVGLTQAYLVLRAAVHRLALQNKPAQLSDQAMLENRAFVRHCWKTLLQGDSSSVSEIQ